MTTEARAPLKLEQGHSKGQYQYLEGRDVVGIVMAGPVFLIGLGLAIYGLGSLLSLGVGVILLLFSVALIIPGKHYDRGITRAIGFAAAVLAIGVSVALAAWVGFFASYAFSGDDFALLGVFFGAVGLAAFAYAIGCADVLLKKLETEQKVAVVVVGIAVGSLLVLLMYLLHFFE